MKRILVFVLILCLGLLLCVGAQEPVPSTEPSVTPAPKVSTRLTVKILDEINDKVIELNNCIVHVAGELHICEDSFNYSNAFTDGDLYDITVWVRLKK